MELIRLSKGSIEIVSGNGYYGIKNEQEITKKLDKSFEGTIISIVFNTNSDMYYLLKDEND